MSLCSYSLFLMNVFVKKSVKFVFLTIVEMC
jgi:hypothetical protein